MIPAEVARLVGQQVEIVGDSYVIKDIAGEGAPLVGVIERRGDELWLVGETTVRLTGPLAHPRYAGPGYKVWVIGTPEGAGALRARRLGVLKSRSSP